MRDPGDSSLLSGTRQLSGRSVRQSKIASVIMFLVGAVMILVALTVFLNQGNEIQVTAKVLSEQCRSQYNAGDGLEETSCDASVRFTTVNGQVIKTEITGASPDEFHGTGQSRTIRLRYDRNDPTQPYKPSDYMTAGAFAVVLSIGVAGTLLGVWAFWRNRRMGTAQR